MKFIYAKREDIPEALRSYYVEEGGQWVLQCEGATSADRLKEFRDNNVTLLKENTEMKEKFKDVDPAEYAKLKKNKALLDEGKLVEVEGLEAAVTKRTEAMRTDLEGRLKKTEEERDSSRRELDTLKIDDAVATLGIAAGLRPQAKEDIIFRARKIFAMDPATGKVVAKDKDGKEMFGKTGNPLTMDEWVKDTATNKDLAHLFLPSNGSNATGSGSGQRASGPNPFLTNNLTEQGRLHRENPALFASMKAEADAAKGQTAGAS